MAKTTSSFAESSAHCIKILESLRGGAYAPLYLLHGTEGYFIDQIESYISENAIADELKAFSQITLWGKECSALDVIAAAKQYPMMGSKSLIVVREAQNLKSIDELASYAAAPVPSTILLLCHKEKTIDKRSALYKKLNANSGAIIFESITPREWEVVGFVNQIIAEYGMKAEPSVAQIIADHVGTNLQTIVNQIDKLKTRLPKNTTITTTHVEQNIGISKEFNNFELTKALSSRNFKTALLIAEHFAKNPKNNPLVVTISTLFTHFQRIATLNLYKWDCAKNKKPVGNDYDIAKILGLSNAYFLNEYTTAASHYPTGKAVEILGLIREWDMRSKGFPPSSASDEELLKELIIRISMI